MGKADQRGMEELENSVSDGSLSALRNPDGISYHLEKLKPTINKIQANQFEDLYWFKVLNSKL